MTNNIYFYSFTFLLCLFFAYFFGFRSRQASGLINLNSILADFGSGSFFSTIIGWLLSIFWGLMLIFAYVGMIYSAYKIFSIFDAGEIKEIKSIEQSNSQKTIDKPDIKENNINPKKITKENEIIKP